MKLRLLQRLRRTKVYAPETFKALQKRLDWEEIESRPRQEDKNVVKGTNKRVVVVKSPDPKVFEQAIFIVREDFFSKRKDRQGANVLREAQDVADRYIRSTVLQPRLRRIPTWLIPAGGVAMLALVWLALHLFGVF